MRREAVVFEAPYRVAVHGEDLAAPAAGEVGVQALVSAVSAGTELLIFRGQVPVGLALDPVLPALAGTMQYPLRYGYALVGRVDAVGPGVDPGWRDRRVFCFHPHASRLTVAADSLLTVPDDVPDEDALFLANMETAVTLVLDGAPRIGESVVVFGQGIVGLLATAVLARFPLGRLLTVDPAPARRRASLAMGAAAALAPADLAPAVRDEPPDLLYELSGEPAVLNAAIDTAGFGSRIVVGSWYGVKSAPLELGGAFHRNRLRLIASQVSTLPPELGPRWTRARRTQVVWDMLRTVAPSRLITHRFPIARAPEAYALLDRREEAAVLQVVLLHA